MKKYVFKKFKGEYAYYKDGFKTRKTNESIFPKHIRKSEVFLFDKEGKVILLNGETINRYILFKNRIKYTLFTLCIIIFISFITVFFLMPSFFHMVYKNDLGDKDFIKKGQGFIDTRADWLNKQNFKSIDGFDLREDTFNFKNISTDASKAGNCFGIAYIEKMNFCGTLDLKKEENKNIVGYEFNEPLEKLNQYVLSEEEVNTIYGPFENDLYDRKDKFNQILNKDFVPKDYSLYRMYELLHAREEENFSEIEEGIKKEILKSINYYQLNYFDIEPVYETIPYVLDKRIDATLNIAYFIGSKAENLFNISKKKIDRNIDVNFIVDKIDENEPLVIAVFSGGSGHAILAYGYEWVGEDYLKVYIKDSNIPLFSDEQKFKEINYDIESNCYMLFQKIHDKWFYKYDPYINEKFIYSHKYNSFMPNSYIKIY